MSQFLPSSHNILKSNQGLQSFILISNVRLGEEGIYNSGLLFCCCCYVCFSVILENNINDIMLDKMCI